PVRGSDLLRGGTGESRVIVNRTNDLFQRAFGAEVSSIDGSTKSQNCGVKRQTFSLLFGGLSRKRPDIRAGHVGNLASSSRPAENGHRAPHCECSCPKRQHHLRGIGRGRASSLETEK